MSGTILKNGTGNVALGKNSIAIGQGCVAYGDNQTVLGRYPDVNTSDSSNDALVIGGGSSKDSRATALRVDDKGEVFLGGGGEIYMFSPDTHDIIPVFMTGTNNRIKKVLMSR